MSIRNLEGITRHPNSNTKTIGSDHYHGAMKKEHPDWNFCPTCNSSLSEQIHTDILGLLLTNSSQKLVISATLSTDAGTGTLRPFSLTGETKIPVWAEASQLGSSGLSRERLFEEVIIQHILPAFRNGFKLAKYSGPEEDVHLFLQVLVKYAQRDLSDRALNLEKSLLNDAAQRKQTEFGISGQDAGTLPAISQSPARKSFTTYYSPSDDPTKVSLTSDSQVSSGTIGLDTVLGGGLPKYKASLVSGPSGSGKTILACQFLLEGVRKGETGILAISGQMPHELLQETEKLGLSLVTAVQQHRIILIVCDSKRVFQIRGIDLINVKNASKLMSVIEKLVTKKNAKRLAIDSLTDLVTPTRRRSVASLINEVFGRINGLQCTSILTSDLVSKSGKLSYYGIEENLASGVVVLGSLNKFDRLTRYMYVPKMKGTNHSLRKYVFTIEDAAGMKIIEPLHTFVQRLEPKKIGAAGSGQIPGPWGDFANLVKILQGMNLHPGVQQAAATFEEQLDGINDTRIGLDQTPYNFHSALSNIPDQRRKNKSPLLKPTYSAVKPRQLSVEEARLTSAADGNPWSGIISTRDQEEQNSMATAGPSTEANEPEKQSPNGSTDSSELSQSDNATQTPSPEGNSELP